MKVHAKGTKKPAWRNVVRIHEAAELYPMLEEAELAALTADIKRNGLRQKATIVPDFDDDNMFTLLDGRNRVAALERLRWPILARDGRPNPDYFQLADEAAQQNPEAYVTSLNLHRRHLSSEQKRAIVAKILVANPEVSDRRIGTVAGVDHKTAGAVRSAMVVTGEIPQLTETVGADGKARPRRRPPLKPLGRNGRAKLWANSAKLDEVIHDIHRLAGNGLDINPKDLTAYLDSETKRTNVRSSARQARDWLDHFLEAAG